MAIAVHSNFLEDLAEHHRDMLAAAGYPMAGVPLHECTELYVNVRSRTIELAPRRVHEASGLQCPAGMEQAFEFFKLKVIAGDDLNPHLSRKLKKADYTDPLLTDWGIQHFHLSMTKDQRGFVTGQKEVLFGRVTPTDIYLVYFGEHKRPDGGDGFADVEIIEALHRSWPDTISHYRIGKTEPFIRSKDDPTPLTSRERADFVRSSNLIAAITVSDGTSYLMNPRVMSGHGLALNQAVANMWFQYQVLQEHARNTVEALVAGSAAAVPGELRLKLIFDRDGNPYVQEQVTGTIVPIPEGWGDRSFNP